MLQRSLVVAVAVAVLAMVGTVQAGEDCACPIKAAMKNLPQLTYVVGEETTHCPKSAAKLSEEHSAPITFAVGDKTFDNKQEAQLHLVKATEAFVADFAKPHTCAVSGTTTVAGQKLHCDVAAGKLASLAKSAIDGVQMTYVVGDETCHCPSQAKTLAAESGAEQVFVVGEEKTHCPTTARLNLARAQYRAAVEAIVQSQQTPAAEQPQANVEVEAPVAAEAGENEA